MPRPIWPLALARRPACLQCSSSCPRYSLPQPKIHFQISTPLADPWPATHCASPPPTPAATRDVRGAPSRPAARAPSPRSGPGRWLAALCARAHSKIPISRACRRIRAQRSSARPAGSLSRHRPRAGRRSETPPRRPPVQAREPQHQRRTHHPKPDADGQRHRAKTCIQQGQLARRDTAVAPQMPSQRLIADPSPPICRRLLQGDSLRTQAKQHVPRRWRRV